MNKRRQVLGQLAAGYAHLFAGAVAIVQSGAIHAAPTPMLNESEPEAQLAQYAPGAPGPKNCANCKNYTPAPETGTGFCKKFPGKRVSAGAVCAKFYIPKSRCQCGAASCTSPMCA